MIPKIVAVLRHRNHIGGVSYSDINNIARQVCPAWHIRYNRSLCTPDKWQLWWYSYSNLHIYTYMYIHVYVFIWAMHNIRRLNIDYSHRIPSMTFVIHHNGDVTMSAMASQITGVSIVYSTSCSVANQRIHKNSASLAFVRGIHRWPVDSYQKGPVTRKMFPFDDVIKICLFTC